MYTCAYVWHDVLINVTWRIDMCDMTYWYVWHDSYMYMTWLVYMCRIAQELHQRIDRQRDRVFDKSLTATSHSWFKHMAPSSIGSLDGVAMMSRLLKIISLFCKRAYKRDYILQKRRMILRSLHLCAAPQRWTSHAYVCHDSFICVPCSSYIKSFIIHMCAITQELRRHIWRQSRWNKSFVIMPMLALTGPWYQCVAVCCSVLQCGSVCCIVLHCVAVVCSGLQCVAVLAWTGPWYQCAAVCCRVLQFVAIAGWCSVLQCFAVH